MHIYLNLELYTKLIKINQNYLQVPPTAVLFTYGSGTLGNASSSFIVLILTCLLLNIVTIK